VLVILAVVFAVNFLPESSLGFDENPYLAVVIIQLLTFAVPALFYASLRGKELKPNLRLRFFPPSHLLFLVQAALFLISGTLLISMALYRISPEAFETSSVSAYASFAMNRRVFDVLYLVVAFAILPAVTEEFVFRGIVLGEYQKDGLALAAVMSAISFSMAHFSPIRFPVYFFAGLVLAVVTYTTRSVVASMVIHALYNAFVLLGEQYVLNVVDKQNVGLTMLVIIIGALALLSGMFLCFEAYNIYRRYAKKNLDADHVPQKKKNRVSMTAQALFSPTFLLLVIVYAVACLMKG